MVGLVSFQIDTERGRKVAKKLYRVFDSEGIFGNTGMPEDITPEGVKEGSLEHLLFITLTVSIDYLRDADQLWNSSRKTYEDPDTRYLFDPRKLHEVSREKEREDMKRYGLAKRPKQDLYIWRTVGVTFYKKWNGDPRCFIEDCNWDAVTVLERLKNGTHKAGGKSRTDFPFLRGPKIGPLWVRMLRDNVGIKKLKNLDKIPIPVDRHVARATLATGVVRGSFEGNLEEIFKKIREAWFDSVEGLEVEDRPMIALDVDEPLWHLSKYGCTQRDAVTGKCSKSDPCEVEEFCTDGKIVVGEDKVKLETG